MTGPKHLWSGDWERESARAAEQRAAQPLPAPSPPAPVDDETRATAARRWGRKQLGIALGSGIAAAAVAAVLVIALAGGSNKPAAQKLASSGAGQQTVPSPQTHTAPQLQNQTPQLQNQTPQACQQNPGACTRSSTVNATGPTANWLGMQIVTSPDGVVISTVTLNSPADAVGLNPGDQITAIDGHPITSVGQIRTDTAGLRLGSQVTIQVQRASVMVQLASLPMTERPTIHP